MKRAYYNEHDKFAAAWLRELIKKNLIAPGDVDERDIQDVKADDLKGYCQVHWFAGIGGWSYALRLAGIPDGEPVWTGSCPCQDFSAAGKGEGHGGSRNLWPEMFRLIRECRPAICFGEQVDAAIRYGWLDGVFVDLEAEDYACGAAVLPAAGVGAKHKRHRIFWIADANGNGHQGTETRAAASNKKSNMAASKCRWRSKRSEIKPSIKSPWPKRLIATQAVHWGGNPISNAIVPQVAAEFIQAYYEIRNHT